MIIVIVLGCKVIGDEPSELLKSRLDKTLEIWDKIKDKDTYIIVSGGNGMYRPMATSKIMKKYLVMRGIEKTKIIEEEWSLNTMENLIFTREMIREMTKKMEGEVEEMYIVTSKYHIPRTRMMGIYVYGKEKKIKYEGVEYIERGCMDMEKMNNTMEMMTKYMNWIPNKNDVKERIKGRKDIKNDGID